MLQAVPMWTAAPPLQLTSRDRSTLETWARAHSTPQSIAVRVHIVLRAADGIPNFQIADDLKVSRPTVILWRNRFEEGGPTALTEIATGRGRKPEVSAEEIIHATLHTKPKGATQWSCRTLAEAVGVGPTTVHRVWRAHGIQPHRVRTFKLS